MLLFHLLTINISFPNFPTNDNSTITLVPTATKAKVDGLLSILLTSNQADDNLFNATGRAYYNQPIPLWDPITKVTTSFTTSFEFTINNYGSSNVSSGGIAFFIASEDSLDTPANSFGGWLGLFNASTDGNSSNRMVAVEFDTYQDEWDSSDNHIGINVNSIVSKTNRTWDLPLTSGDIYVATVSYDGTTKDLNVVLQDPDVLG